jgi:hypothetical protein
VDLVVLTISVPLIAGACSLSAVSAAGRFPVVSGQAPRHSSPIDTPQPCCNILEITMTAFTATATSSPASSAGLGSTALRAGAYESAAAPRVHRTVVRWASRLTLAVLVAVQVGMVVTAFTPAAESTQARETQRDITTVRAGAKA